MKHVTLGTLILLLLSFVQAQTSSSILGLEDTNFDYTDAGVDEGYIQLEYVDGILEVVLSSSEVDTQLPAIEIVGLPLTDDDYYLSRPDAADLIDNFEVDYRSQQIKGLTFSHEAVKLQTVVDTYNDILTGFGFSINESSTSINSQIVSYEGPSGTVRIVFNQLGDNVQVHLSS